MPTHELPPSFALFRLATGFYVSRAIHVVASLGIADMLADRPRHSDELAEVSRTHADSLRRVLRLLASAGVLIEEETGRFALTPVGACLRSGVPGSMRAAALLFGGITQQAWGDLLHSVKTGEPAFRYVFGMESLEYLARHPDEAANFDEAMAGFTKHIASAPLCRAHAPPHGVRDLDGAERGDGGCNGCWVLPQHLSADHRRETGDWRDVADAVAGSVVPILPFVGRRIRATRWR